ncbi:MAG: type IV pilus assembly protein PilM [Myxococcota bacterium]
MATRNAVGVDIGASAIKVAQVRETPQGLQLMAFDSLLLPPDTLRDGVIRQPALLIQRLKDVFQLNGIKPRQVALAVSGPSVFVQRLRLPRLSDAQYQAALRFQAEQHVPFDVSDAYLDGVIVDPSPDPSHMDVLLVAARKAAVDEWTSVARAARLQPVVVDVATLAVCNAFEASGQGAADEVSLLLDIGAAQTHLAVVSRGVPLLARDVATGGNAVTEEVARHFGVPWDEAEHLKTTNDTDLSTPDVLREVQRISARGSEALVEEVRQTLDQLPPTSPRPTAVWLSGGAAPQLGLAEALEKRLGVTVHLLDPFRRLTVDPNKFDAILLRRMAPCAAVAVGLALRGMAEADR